MYYEYPKRFINRVFIHCSASDHDHHDDISVIKNWHMKRGWSDVGYHYFIKKDGTIQHGRSLNRHPAAQKGHNLNTIAICLHGLKPENFTCAQFAALQDLCKEIQAKHKGKRGLTFHGHCEVSHKLCPVFDYGTVLNLDDKGNLGI